MSVVIPSYNRGRYIAETVRSVLSQTMSQVEVIVVDDGSTDETPEVLEGFGSDIRVIRRFDNGERGAARNAGAAVSEGSFLAFLDSDDVWESNKLELQLPYLRAGEVVTAGIRFIGPNGDPLGRIYVPGRNAYKRLSRENRYLATPSAMALPRAIFERIGGFPEERQIQGSEDWLFLLRLRRARYVPNVVAEPVVRYRVHDQNWTADVSRVASCMWAATEQARAEQLVDASEFRGMRAHTAAVIARQYAAVRDVGQTRRWLGESARCGGMVKTVGAIGMALASAGRGAIRRAKR